MNWHVALEQPDPEKLDAAHEKMLRAIWEMLTTEGACVHHVCADLVGIAAKILAEHGYAEFSKDLERVLDNDPWPDHEEKTPS